MLLSFADWSIIIAFFVISLGIGIYVSKKSGKSAKTFSFLVEICRGGC